MFSCQQEVLSAGVMVERLQSAAGRGNAGCQASRVPLRRPEQATCLCQSCALACWLQILYMDTEGFEASGKSDAYDDRIFALSTVVASVLVYNLPETVRESDVEKLSFAVELADAFFSDSQACACTTLAN